MTNIEARIENLKHIVKVVNHADYDEPYIYDNETGEFFSCVDVMYDYYEDNNLEMPKYAYGVYFEPIKLDLDDILESACEEHHEDAFDSLNCIIELREAINKFNKDNEDNGSYFEDINTIVELF